jgi:hypothetical protein
MRIFTSSYTTTVPISCYTYTRNVASSEKYNLLRQVSSSPMRENMSKANCFLESWSLLIIFGPVEACRHAISVTCAKHHEQQSSRHCSGTPYGMVAHVVARQLLFNMHKRSINRYCLVHVHLINIASDTGVGFQLCKLQNATQFLIYGKHLFNWSKKVKVKVKVQLSLCF